MSRIVIALKSPSGRVPNVRIIFFNEWEFHLHARILGYNCRYFRQLLTAPNVEPDGQGQRFLYELCTMPNANGKGWQLVPAANAEKKVATLDLDERRIIKALKNLFHVFYYQTPKVETPDDFIALTEVAQYHGALRQVSESFNEIYRRCEWLRQGAQLRDFAPKLIHCAAKLRLRELFNDLVVYLAGDYPIEQHWPDWDAMHMQYKSIVEIDRSRLADQVDLAKYKMKRELTTSLVDTMFAGLPEDKQRMSEILNETRTQITDACDESALRHPKLFRLLHDDPDFYYRGFRACEDIDSMLESNLMLDIESKSGKGAFENWFLSADLQDNEYPWDINNPW